MYVYTRNGTAWSHQTYIKASNTGAGDNFGWSIALHNQSLVVTASGEDSSTTGINSRPNELASNAGAAYIFGYNGTTWSQSAYVKAANTDAGDSFGASVAIHDKTIVIGANGEDSSATGVNGNRSDNSATNAGAGYVFGFDGTTWSQQAYLKAANTDSADDFGFKVAINVNTIVVGAEFEASTTTGINSIPNNNASMAGAAYVFGRIGTT